MKMRKVTFRPEKGADQVTIETNLPANQAEFEKMFTPSEAWEQAEANIDVKAQAIMRAHYAKLAAGKESELPVDWVSAVKYKARESQMDKLKKVVAGLSAEEIKELLKAAKGAK